MAGGLWLLQKRAMSAALTASVLVHKKLALSECLNASWIDDAHPFFEAVKVQRERFPICARRLHADVHIPRLPGSRATPRVV